MADFRFETGRPILLANKSVYTVGKAALQNRGRQNAILTNVYVFLARVGS